MGDVSYPQLEILGTQSGQAGIRAFDKTSRIWLASLSWRWERHSSSRLGVVQNVTFKVSLEKPGGMFMLLGENYDKLCFFCVPKFQTAPHHLHRQTWASVSQLLHKSRFTPGTNLSALCAEFQLWSTQICYLTTEGQGNKPQDLSGYPRSHQAVSLATWRCTLLGTVHAKNNELCIEIYILQSELMKPFSAFRSAW